MTTSVQAPAAGSTRPSPRWMYDALADTALGWCWLPFFVLAHLLGRFAPSGGGAVAGLLSVVLLLSLAHQPLTLLLVYGDRQQMALRRRFFALAPLVAVVAVGVAVSLDLWVLVPIAAVWNTVHTLQQRYGLLRIYSRKSRYGAAILDRAVTYLPFVAVLVAAATLPQAAAQLESVASSFGGTNSAGVRLLLEARDVLLILLPPLALAAAGATALYVRQEVQAVRTGQANPAKWSYLAGTVLLLASIVVDPLAGLIAYIAAHAVEYIIVVARTLRSRYGGSVGSSPLAVLAATPERRTLLLVGFLGLLIAAALLLRAALDSREYLVLIYTVGVLHFTYDALIWKARKPKVAAVFGVAPPPSDPRR